MNSLKILNNKEKRKIINEIKQQYGINKLDLDYIFLKNRDNKIFILSRDFAKVNTENIRINSLGLYFAKINTNGIRLSIEGSQLVGDFAKRNILDVNKEETNLWVRGHDLTTDKELNGYIIIKYNNSYFGSGLYKDGKIKNMIPKDRIIKREI